MARREVHFVPHECYHVYNRGYDKGRIFFERKNYTYYLEQFRKHIPASKVQVLAYCLMPNHYHFLLRIIEGLDFSRAMKNFSIGYVKAINKKYMKVGHLFQGAFQAIHVDSTEYLLHLSRYIHMNPVFAKLVHKPEEWNFSSYCRYLRIHEDPIVDPDFILSHFQSVLDYKKFVEAISDAEAEKINGTF